MTKNPKYDIVYKESLFQGYFRVERIHVRQELADGKWSAPFSREVFNCAGDAAVVILFDPHQDKVVMIEQFRAGPAIRGDDPFMLEFVAGAVVSGETPEKAARREAREEADCEVLALQKIFTYYPTPGGVSEHVTLFVGRTRAPEDGIVCGVAGESEYIRVHVFDAAQAIALLYAGKLKNAATIIGMQWFALHHTDLRSQWLVSEASTPII